MIIIYKTDDGAEFETLEEAQAFEALERTKVTYTEEKTLNLISESQLKKIFEINSVFSMSFYLQDEKGKVYLDGDYETFSIDDTGHLNCTDLHHGLLEWCEKEQSYFRIVYGRAEKVKFLGIKSVIYI